MVLVRLQDVKAVYVIILKLEEPREIEIGALGGIKFAAGLYVYVGSAMNSVEKRVERHFSEVENLHWHIDYFSAEAEAVDFLVVPESSEFECVLADAVSRVGEAVPGFGSSDCDCPGHLFRVK
jgi:sugar fermentation stimulation protein A